MQHISEVENARSKKSREKFRFQASLVWCRFSGKSRTNFGTGREKWCWENNDFPQYVEIFGLSRRNQSGWAGDSSGNLCSDWLSA